MTRTRHKWLTVGIAGAMAMSAIAHPSFAQQDTIDGIGSPAAPEAAAPDAGAPGVPEAAPPAFPDGVGNTTIIPRSDAAPGAQSAGPAGPDQLQLVALLTADGQKIDQGVVWRIYAPLPEAGKVKLISTHEEASPRLTLKPGEYVVNAAFGRAYLTRKISLKAGAGAVEQFVLNAGGLRVTAKIGDTGAPGNTVRFNIYSDRDQQDNRRTIMLGAKPGVVVRLNAGIYQIESTYGDANATVRTDVTVEAGKLTEAALKHAAARATFKLVSRSGGDATADTQWRVETATGQLVKENVGAFPTHMLAPGKYVAIAKHGGKVFKREFSLDDGVQQEIEVLME
jgi:hypothetical protein